MTSLIGIVDTEPRATTLVEELKKARFQSPHIRLFTKPAREKVARPSRGGRAKSSGPSPLTIGVAGTMGWLAGGGNPAVAGSGQVASAGPMVPALSGALMGLGENDVLQTITDMGVPGKQAKRYEKILRKGGVLIAVQAENADELARAREVFHRCGAGSIFPSDEGEA